MSVRDIAKLAALCIGANLVVITAMMLLAKAIFG